MAKKRTTKVPVRSSRAHRRSGHHRDATDVRTSKPLRIQQYNRHPRRAKADVEAMAQAYQQGKRKRVTPRDRRALERRGLL